MATVSVPNRTIIGWLFLIGGALQIIGAVVGFANAGNASAIYAISNIAIGVGLVLMMAWLATTPVARIGYFIGALGWLLLALTSLINLGVLGTIAVYIAIIGSVFAGVIVLTGRPFAGRADIIFFVAMLLGAIELLFSQNGGNVPAVVELVLIICFGGLLGWSGILMFHRRAAVVATRS